MHPISYIILLQISNPYILLLSVSCHQA
uniref:ATP binding protein n=1 Tax=Rhizophora mucronata TaxID=61149 RepID=A0A2P2MEJ2_RHIMU